MNTLFIIRGLPGSGKNTLGESLCPGRCFSADQYFEVDGEYRFDPKKLREAHVYCQSMTQESLLEGNTAVANTFTQAWEYTPYIDMAEKMGCRWQLISLFDQSLSLEGLMERSLHGVPAEAMQRMHDRYQH